MCPEFKADSDRRSSQRHVTSPSVHWLSPSYCALSQCGTTGDIHFVQTPVHCDRFESLDTGSGYLHLSSTFYPSKEEECRITRSPNWVHSTMEKERGICLFKQVADPFELTLQCTHFTHILFLYPYFRRVQTEHHRAPWVCWQWFYFSRNIG